MDEPIASSASNRAGDEEPIFSLAWDCDDLIKACSKAADVSVEPKTKFLIEDFERRFDGWWMHLGVFADEKANLDRRLRRKPDIRDIVVRLLLILKRNLEQLRQYLTDNEANIPSPALGNEGNEDVEMTEALASSYAVATDAIDESLSELAHVAIAIRESAKTAETVRARRFAAEHLDLEPYEAIAFLAVETLYPNAPQSLVQQVTKSMVDRYARLCYRAPRHSMLKTDMRRHMQGNHDAALLSSATAYAEPQAPVITQLSLSAKRKIHAPSTFAPTSIDSKLFQHRVSHPHHPKSRSGATTAILGKTLEPPVPQFENNDEVQCQWCFVKISQSLVNKGQWTVAGREHYRTDLEPFPCLADECMDTLPCFSSITKWSEHMRSHGTMWTQHIHHEPAWRCPFEHQTHALFSSPGHLHGHIRALHKDETVDMDDMEIFDIADASSNDQLREPNTCPLCGFVPGGPDVPPETVPTAVSQTSIAGAGVEDKPRGVKRRKVVAFQGQPVPEQSEPEPAESLPDEDDEYFSVSWAMESHITGHLQFLMVLSLRLMETQYLDQDAKSQGSSMSPVESHALLAAEDMSSLHFTSHASSEGLETANTLPQSGENVIPLAVMDWTEVMMDKTTRLAEDPILDHMQAMQHLSLGDKVNVPPFLRKDSPLFISESVKNECLQSIVVSDAESQSGHTIPDAYPGTGDWIFDTDEFRSPLQSGSSILWITGILGSGKSVLLKHVLRKLRQPRENGVAVAAYFFDQDCGYSGMLKCSVKQWATQDDRMFQALYRKYQDKLASSGNLVWDDLELEELLFSMAAESSRSTSLLVDSMDSCDDPERAIRFLRKLEECINPQTYPLICISSRHYPQFSTEGHLKIGMEDHNAADIRHYIETRFMLLEDLCGSEKSIIAKARGLFLWVELIMRSCIEIKRTSGIGHLQEVVIDDESGWARLPADLAQLYTQLLLDADVEALNILRVAALSFRPLEARELAWANHATRESFGYGRPPILSDRDYHEYFLGKSRGLLMITSKRFEVIHDSVRIYILKTRAPFKEALGQAHVLMRELCHKCLEEDDISHPFLLYASMYLVEHAEWAQRLGEDQEDFLRIYSAHEAFQRLVKAHDAKSPERDRWGHDSTLLYIAAGEGYASLVTLLIHMGDDVNSCGGLWNYPLHAAAVGKHEDVVRILLERGADPNALDHEANSALQIAVRLGFKDTAKVLLDYGADANANGPSGTALANAANNNDTAIVKLLLDRGADINIEDRIWGTALQATTYSGAKEVARLLLDTGADINMKAGLRFTALQAAARIGNKDIVRLFLESGADVNTVGGHYGTAVQAAAYGGEADIVIMLLEAGADPYIGRYTDVSAAALEGGHSDLSEELKRKLAGAGAGAAKAVVNKPTMELPRSEGEGVGTGLEILLQPPRAPQGLIQQPSPYTEELPGPPTQVPVQHSQPSTPQSISLTTPTLKYSRFTRAHYMNPDFQPELFDPEADDFERTDLPSRRKKGSMS